MLKEVVNGIIGAMMICVCLFAALKNDAMTEAYSPEGHVIVLLLVIIMMALAYPRIDEMIDAVRDHFKSEIPSE